MKHKKYLIFTQNHARQKHFCTERFTAQHRHIHGYRASGYTSHYSIYTLCQLRFLKRILKKLSNKK